MMQSFISSTLTPAWLSARLGEPVKSLQVEPINHRGGYLADLYRVHYSTRRGEHTLVLKTEAADPARRDTAERYQSYWKESLFYRQVASATSINVPHCYFNQQPPGFALLLEDLGLAAGLEPAAGITPDAATLGVRTLGRLHDTRIDSAGLPSLEAAFRAAATELPELCAPLMEDSRAGRIIQRYAGNSLDYLPRFTSRPQVVTHLDYRQSNLCFRQDQLTVFDWGEWCLAPAGLDLAYFLVFSLDPSQRRACETELLATYQQNCERQYPADTLLASYRLGMLPALYLPAMMLKRQQQPALAGIMKDRLVTAISDHADWFERELWRAA